MHIFLHLIALMDEVYRMSNMVHKQQYNSTQQEYILDETIWI